MFDEILAAIVSRIPTALRPRIVAQPTQSNVVTLAEQGVHLWVGSPQPFSQSGGYRYAHKVDRAVGAIVVSTPSLRDPGGRDDAAVKALLATEIDVVDAIIDFKNAPADSGAVMIRWVPGGDEVNRWVKLNPGCLSSSLLFNVTYAANLTRPF